MRNLTFTPNGWEDYEYWLGQDKKTLKRINKLIKDIRRTPFTGLGKPELLKFDLKGCWSRRIDDANRLVYTVSDENITVLMCRYHYDK
jgi:toxin YoeB|tara:strand:- start:187 stop:450 length:264 start_codon:yes stop_codon:yes gene_type:complete